MSDDALDLQYEEALRVLRCRAEGHRMYWFSVDGQRIGVCSICTLRILGVEGAGAVGESMRLSTAAPSPPPPQDGESRPSVNAAGTPSPDDGSVLHPQAGSAKSGTGATGGAPIRPDSPNVVPIRGGRHR